jgi:hypothetical protein
MVKFPPTVNRTFVPAPAVPCTVQGVKPRPPITTQELLPTSRKSLLTANEKPVSSPTLKIAFVQSAVVNVKSVNPGIIKRAP